MFLRVIKRMEIAASHKLNLPYESKCKTRHGHNWIVEVHCKMSMENFNSNATHGMVVDFKHIKNVIMLLDHEDLNSHMDQPTAENICCHLFNNLLRHDRIKRSTVQIEKIRVRESENNWVELVLEDGPNVFPKTGG